MKYIVAIVNPARLKAVKDALTRIHVSGITVSDVRGYGRQKGHKEVYRGQEYHVDLRHKCKIEIAVNEDDVRTTVDVIVKAARSGNEGKIGDGKVFILPLENAIRIRTGEAGCDVLTSWGQKSRNSTPVLEVRR